MTQKTDASIQRLVAIGKYEEALDVKFNASFAIIARAHIRQLHRYSHSELSREALNQAKTVLQEESIERKTQRFLNLGHMEEAFSLLEENLNDSATAYEHYMLGYILYRMGRYVESTAYMEKAFVLNDSPFHAIWLGCALERQGKLESALEKYLLAIDKRGHETEHRMAGNLYFHLGNGVKALNHLQKAISLGCKDDDVLEKVTIVQQRNKIANFKERVKGFFSYGKDNDPTDKSSRKQS